MRGPGRGRSAAGSASPCQGEGRGFESRRPLEAPCPPPQRRRLVAGSQRRHGGVAEWLRQGPAKPCTRVRFPPPPRDNHRNSVNIRAISSVGEHYLDTVGVTGSIPVSPTTTPPGIAGVQHVSDDPGQNRVTADRIQTRLQSLRPTLPSRHRRRKSPPAPLSVPCPGPAGANERILVLRRHRTIGTYRTRRMCDAGRNDQRQPGCGVLRRWRGRC